MPTFTNEPDSDLYSVLGEKQDWYGAGLKRRTAMTADLGSAYSAGAAGQCSVYGGERLTKNDLGAPTNIGTPCSPTDPCITEIRSRGDIGFSEAGWSDIFGKPQKPGQA
jgi:hypothetical protein